MTASSGDVKPHRVVSHDEWVAARTDFLGKEKEFTRARDLLSRQRRELPWERVAKVYEFVGPDGSESLADLFGDQSQLIVYHFMFPPDWDEGCLHCSFWADSFDGIDVHLAHRDVSFLAISRAPFDKIQAFKKRMGWRFKWVSSHDTDFNYDFQASFTQEQVDGEALVFNYATQAPGLTDREGASAFYKDSSGAIFHTYSTYGRGIDILNSAYNFLDMAPKGRDEDELPDTQAWVRHHDRYVRRQPGMALRASRLQFP